MDEQNIKPGYYPDISNHAYHSGPGISKSHLDVIAQSARHYWAKYIDPNREPEEPAKPLIMGSAIHCAVLEPDLFPAQYVAEPEGIDRRTKDGKAAWAEFMSSAAGKTPLSGEDFAMVLKVRDAVHAHPLASGLLKNGRAEQTFYAIDEETGELVKCRADWLCDSGMVVDLKSTEDASPDGFPKSVANWRYHVQHPWYCDVIKGAVQVDPVAFVFIAVEKKWPHAIGVYYLDEEDIAIGRALARRDLKAIHHFRQINEWPDYGETPRAIQLPPWARRKFANTL